MRRDELRNGTSTRERPVSKDGCRKVRLPHAVILLVGAGALGLRLFLDFQRTIDVPLVMLHVILLVFIALVVVSSHRAMRKLQEPPLWTWCFGVGLLFYTFHDDPGRMFQALAFVGTLLFTGIAIWLIGSLPSAQIGWPRKATTRGVVLGAAVIAFCADAIWLNVREPMRLWSEIVFAFSVLVFLILGQQKGSIARLVRRILLVTAYLFLTAEMFFGVP